MSAPSPSWVVNLMGKIRTTYIYYISSPLVISKIEVEIQPPKYFKKYLSFEKIRYSDNALVKYQ